jgi:chromosomal replication initiation ATPase DnaA
MQSDNTRPNLHNLLFWEYNLELTDWQRDSVGIIERVLERGTHEEWDELVRFYGIEKVTHILKDELRFLFDHVIEDVCEYFKVKKEDLLCFKRKQTNPGHWP